ncbi:MAG: 50S ribosomal protein L23 [Erysipelotrichaceae bacterium]|nr:50S ribosomal protein L23 [Erysipelotrichaceae bacterium]
MSNARDIIVKPLITEKTMALQAENTYVFEVAKFANKINIKQAIEEIFKVKVVSVNTVNVHPKKKRVGRYTGFSKAIKKAYVEVKDGDSIEILKDK